MSITTEVIKTEYSKNKLCPSWLGVHIAEQVLSKVFKNVVKQPYGFPGYDFVCNRGMKIDSKAACLGTHNNKKRTQWKFDINHNQIADYFLCIAFDNRTDLNPLHLWLIPGHVLNNKSCASITKSSIDKWNEYILDIDKISKCCNVMKTNEE